MQHDTEVVPAPDRIDWGMSRQHAAKQRVAIQHEVVRLLDALAPERPALRREPAPSPVRAYRWPNRCILQGDSRAISVSWFPGDRDDDSLGEMMVIAWDGIVSLPGSGRRAGEEAVAVSSLVLRPEEAASGTWEWRTEEHDIVALATPALAAYCREQLER